MVLAKWRDYFHNKIKVGWPGFSEYYANVTPGLSNLWALRKSDTTSASPPVKFCALPFWDRFPIWNPLSLPRERAVRLSLSFPDLPQCALQIFCALHKRYLWLGAVAHACNVSTLRG